MKQNNNSSKFLVSGLFLIASHSSLALNAPIEGLYFGGQVGGTYTAKLDNMPPTNPGITSLSGKPDLGFTGGFQFGYRFLERFRAEAEYFGTYDKVRNLTVDGASIPSTGISSDSNIHTPWAFMANVFFDFIQSKGGTYSKHVPYIGIGYGVAKANTYISYKADGSSRVEAIAPTSENVTVGQVIVGYSQFLDDYTTIGIDYRYRKYSKLKALNQGYARHVIAFTFKCALSNLFKNT